MFSRRECWRTHNDDIQSGALARSPQRTEPQPRRPAAGLRLPPRKPADPAGERRNAGHTAAPGLLKLIARSTSLVELLPQLHQHALDAAHGRCSLLFEHNVHSGALHATSAYGLDALPTEPWFPTEADAQILSKTFSGSTPTFVMNTARQLPALAHRLGTNAALLLPLQQGGRRLGLLAIGVDEAPARPLPLTDVGDAFMTALELFRLRQNESLQRDLRIVLDEFAGAVGVTLNVSSSLDAFCLGTNRLFGAERTSVWVHDRRTRHLVMHASSDAFRVTAQAEVEADDPRSPAAVAMRRSRAGLVLNADLLATSNITIPLRGCRRALGSLLIEGVRIEAGRELAVLDCADQIGRQLSSAMENLQLLDDLVRSRRELENTFDSITHLVAVWDRRGRIAHVNHAFASRVGLTRDELLERPFEEFVGPELRQWLAKQASDEPAAGGASPVTIDVLDPVLNGPFMVTVTALRNHERERVGSVLVARDLTAQARMQEEREELRRRLGQSEKLAALGQFVAGIAHELNNPLQGVLGHLELLRATGAFPRKLRREVQTIYREADRAAKIVRNLLAFSGSRRLVRRAVSINAVLQKVTAIRASACRAGDIEVVRHYDTKLPRVQSDPLLLHQVFLNIVMNAEHAITESGRGGRIEITTAVAPSSNRVIVSVRDTGVGIPPDVVSRIFEPFYTTKEVGKGSGLGLAITYGIVQEHGGEIVAANHPDGGAVITIELPIRPVTRREPEAAVLVLN
jgi:PAS domain S-box-containing protein